MTKLDAEEICNTDNDAETIWEQLILIRKMLQKQKTEEAKKTDRNRNRKCSQ